jgi:hypothetical protein
MPVLTQAAAIRILRRDTNRSFLWCETTAKSLAKYEDGKRLKIRLWDLNNAIREENIPIEIKGTAGIRPLSEKKKQRIRDLCS